MWNKSIKKRVTGIILIFGICLLVGCGTGKENESSPTENIQSKEAMVETSEDTESSTISGSVETSENTETTEVQEADYTVATGGAFTTSEVEKYAVEVRTNILESDWETLAEKLAYPITINGNMLLDSSDFLGINIDKILCQDFVDVIEAEDCRQMFCNWQGISMGDAGQVWIGCVVEDESDVQLKVFAINNMLELSEEDLMIHRFYERFYDGELTYEKMNEILDGRGGCYQASCYYEDITYYWEVICGTTDVTNFTDPLFYTDMKCYTIEDFAHATPVAIHLAKNEIYAKHGYIFKNEDLNNYFLGCTWYTPLYTAEEFDVSVFNDFERENLEILAALDEKGFQDMISSANQSEIENTVTEDAFYNADEYGSVEKREQHYSNSQGQEGYYYMVDSFYLKDETNSGKYALVNQTLQNIYDEKERQYQAYCMEQIVDYEWDDSITNELQRVNYVSWYLVNIPYIGEDYVSILFNDIEYYAGAAHPFTYFSPITISVETGEIVTPEKVLGKSWMEICEVVGMNVQNEEEFMDEYGFYLTDHTLTYIYRTNVFVEEIVVKR